MHATNAPLVHQITHHGEPGKVYEAHCLPDWSAIAEALNEPPDPTTEPAERRADTALAVRRLIQRLVADTPEHGRTKLDAGVVGKRLLALVWALDRTLLDGSPSLEATAKKMHASRSDFGRYVVTARNEFLNRKEANE